MGLVCGRPRTQSLECRPAGRNRRYSDRGVGGQRPGFSAAIGRRSTRRRVAHDEVDRTPVRRVANVVGTTNRARCSSARRRHDQPADVSPTPMTTASTPGPVAPTQARCMASIMRPEAPMITPSDVIQPPASRADAPRSSTTQPFSRRTSPIALIPMALVSVPGAFGLSSSARPERNRPRPLGVQLIASGQDVPYRRQGWGFWE